MLYQIKIAFPQLEKENEISALLLNAKVFKYLVLISNIYFHTKDVSR